jgi:hypothetical protein
VVKLILYIDINDYRASCEDGEITVQDWFEWFTSTQTCKKHQRQVQGHRDIDQPPYYLAHWAKSVDGPESWALDKNSAKT